MTVRKAFGWLFVIFFILAAFFSIVLHNAVHAIVIFAVGAIGVFLLMKDYYIDIFNKL